MEREYVKLVVNRPDGDDSPNYELRGLPAGEDFRDGENYDRLEACWLKVNGVGFAAAGAEFSEHNHTITVKQETDGGSAHIEL